ncbi:MAG: pyrroline-5-carboxylate reductase [Anaerovoracaceae bacterium]|jgi:pyrroline-5-carboxylate reductase
MRIGFIGMGNMGIAILKGYLNGSNNDPRNITVYDIDEAKLEGLSDELGINVAKSESDVVRMSHMVILAIKPDVYDRVLSDISGDVKDDTIILSLAAGIKVSYIEGFFKKNIKVVRVMPNTPALTGKGMSALCHNSHVGQEDFEKAISLFKTLGLAEPVDERLMDAVIGVSGSSPAYVYMFIEALADGAVEQGMPRKQAYTFAAQAVIGAASMVMETGIHPGELKDMVCSPGGTTIAAVGALEEKGFRDAVITAVRKAAEKSREMDR